MKLPLKPIKPKRISDQVFDQLTELIARGELKPGDKLMPERELSAVLGVSRTTIRNAINKLVVLGFLDHKQGQGTFVRLPDVRDNNPLAIAMQTEDATLEDLLEVRMGLECNAAALAARRAVEEDIHFLEKSLEEMKAEVASDRLGTEADVSFHMAVSYATKNPVQVRIMREFYDFLFYGINENLARLYEKPERIEEILFQHTQIIHAIKKHDPDEAYEAMERHIIYVLNFFKNQDL
ncbi:FadR/GntR family transcriptional regulator [Desulfococcaceae bacterium HSG8]|nr:FadR/GntR family transcriptional regulator [Desulfococcaceae bacterium HSG8]